MTYNVFGGTLSLTQSINHLFCVTVSLYLADIFQRNLPQIFNHHVSGNCYIRFKGQRSKVKVISVQMCKCSDGRAIYSNSV